MIGREVIVSKKKVSPHKEMVYQVALTSVRAVLQSYVIKNEAVPVEVVKDLLEATALQDAKHIKRDMRMLAELMGKYSQQMRLEAVAKSNKSTP